MKPYAIIARVALSLALAVLVVHGTFAHAAEIKVLSSNGVHPVMDEMVPEFERATGHKVSIDYDTTNVLLGRIKAGEPADLTILTKPVIEDLIKQGKIVAGSGKALSSSGVGVAVKAGLPKPDISSVDAFKRALLEAKSIAFTKTGASGIHFANVVERLGIAEQVNAKAKVPSGGMVGELVAQGEAEMAVQQVPELMAVPGIQFVGPLPPELQIITVLSTGVLTGARQAEAAKALIDFLKTPAAARVFKAKGMEPQ
jgi:molybdate transport system substrate-binding protein